MEKLKGGLGDGKSDSAFDSKQLDKGVKVEREHLKDPKARLEIAKDHLTEDPKYYDHLAEMEHKAKKEKKAMLHPYLQGVQAAKHAFQISDDDKATGDKYVPYLGAVDFTPFAAATGLSSAALAPEGFKSRMLHGVGGSLGSMGGQLAGVLGGGLTGAIIGALLGTPVGAALGSTGAGAMTGGMLGGSAGALGGGLYGGYKGTQLGRQLAGGADKKPEKKKDDKPESPEKKDDKE